MLLGFHEHVIAMADLQTIILQRAEVGYDLSKKKTLLPQHSEVGPTSQQKLGNHVVNLRTKHLIGILVPQRQIQSLASMPVAAAEGRGTKPTRYQMPDQGEERNAVPSSTRGLRPHTT